ncbi:MAG: dephospho-CoA kinase [Rubritalea sp.]|uniref:dephospho-CoA kinase n=1 Tax=Rubritalea sp. TaxID=2109375 RepID=UPI00324213C0
MRVLGLTGGIATGKSTCVELIRGLDPCAVIFDADQCVAALYQRSDVAASLVDLVGQSAYLEGAELNRSYLRERMFADPDLRREMQALIHPLVRKECLVSLEKTSKKGGTTSFIADVPLLFEGGFDFGQDANLVVAVSRETQEQRLIMRSGFDVATVHAILEAQLPISHKEKCADVVFWNEGVKSVLKAQVKRFIENNYR